MGCKSQAKELSKKIDSYTNVLSNGILASEDHSIFSTKWIYRFIDKCRQKSRLVYFCYNHLSEISGIERGITNTLRIS